MTLAIFALAGLVLALALVLASGGDSAPDPPPPSLTDDAPAGEYGGLVPAQAARAVVDTRPEINAWLAGFGVDARLPESLTAITLTNLLLADSEPNGGRDAWLARIPLEGDVYGYQAATVCVWAWEDPVDPAYYRTAWNIC